MGSFRAGAVLGAALLLTAACSTEQQGTPTAAANTNTSVPPTSKTSASTKPSVNRPKTIDLKSTDSCKILSAVPAADFGWQGSKIESRAASVFPGMTSCFVITRDFGATVTAVTNMDADTFTHNGQSNEITSTQIAGFPAFTFVPKAIPGVCFTGVSVADGQMLYTQWNTNKVDSPPMSEICGNVAKLATSAMAAVGAS